MKIAQEMYAAAAIESRKRQRKAMSDPQLVALCKAARALPPSQQTLDNPLVKKAGRALIKAGVTTTLGFNFFDLRGPAYMIFPINTPFLQMIGSSGKVNAGVGTAAHWKATRNPNSTFVYAGVVEGQRNALATPNEIDYLATYKELGEEGGETFTAQWAGEGYTDNLADEHFRNLARLRLEDEMITLWGNSGTASGNLGFALGQATNVTSTLATGTGTLGSGANVVVAVVAITGMGMNPGGQAGYNAPPSVLGGLTTFTTRANADGTSTNVAGGISQISNVAAIVTTNSAAQLVNVSISAMQGAVAYAWFWGVNVAASAANVKLGAITHWPSYQISAPATGVQTGAATGLNQDNSFQFTDYDGLNTYAFNNGKWTDMNGGTFTSAGNGQVAEIEADLQFLWDNYQAQPDAIWVSSDVRRALESAVIYSSTGVNSYIFQTDKAGQASLMAGFTVSSYKSKYSMDATGAAAIPIRLHPMMAPGTLMYDINTNPYPSSRIPAVRQYLLQRDYYSIEWPVVTRQWTFGTYIHKVLAHYVPWITSIRTGIGPYVAPCWIAAAVFEEDFFTGPRVNLVRRWLVNDYEKSGLVAELVMGLYRKYGQRIARRVERGGLLKKAFSKLFHRALAKAQEKYAE